MKKYPLVTLRMKDGSTKNILGGPHEFALCDRSIVIFKSTVRGARIRPSRRLDTELSLLRNSISIEGEDGERFSELKSFISKLDTRAVEVTTQRRKKP